MAVPLSASVRSFLARHIGSIEMLESLLLVFSEPERHWTADELGREARTNDWSAERQLHALAQQGLLWTIGQRPTLYRANPAFHEIVGDVARSFRERRVAVIAAIYAAPGNA